MRIATWAIRWNNDGVEDVALAIGKSILSIPAIFFLVSWPLSNGPGASRSQYLGFPYRCYEYPKHALNSLDSAPTASTKVKGQKKGDDDTEYEIHGEQKRLVRPRALVVYREGGWHVVDDGSYTGLYLFVSYAAAQYQVPDLASPDSAATTLDSQSLDFRARRLCEQFGVEAYWCDYHCRASIQPHITDDVHRFCDVVRGAHQICILLPDASPSSLIFFGQRLWCLPEVLLSRNHKVVLCTPGPQKLQNADSTESVDIMEMVHRGWAYRTLPDQRFEHDPTVEETFRLLAEHYTGTLALSRLELIQVALTALRSRQWREFQRGDIAYALMTLLAKRPRMDPSDTELQALARLSLANDSDRIVERMICMDQLRLPGHVGWFNTSDDLGASLWDIEPLCQVAGVCYDGSLIVDGCHGISIRWKDIPRIAFRVRDTWKKLWAFTAVRTAPLWVAIGAGICAVPSLRGLGAFLLVIGFLLLLIAPWCISVIYGGKVWGATPWLVGFEGTLSLEEIEHMTFGNSIGRFTYTPSSGPYCSRMSDERIGDDPSSNFGKLAKGHRLFTLVDTVSCMLDSFLRLVLT